MVADRTVVGRGPQGVVYDKALRGKHKQTLLYALLVNSVTLQLARRGDRVQDTGPPLTTTAA